MSRRSAPERLDTAWQAGVRNRLTGEGMTEATADAWIAVWEVHAAQDVVERGSGYWEAAWVGSPLSQRIGSGRTRSARTDWPTRGAQCPPVALDGRPRVTEPETASARCHPRPMGKAPDEWEETSTHPEPELPEDQRLPRVNSQTEDLHELAGADVRLGVEAELLLRPEAGDVRVEPRARLRRHLDPVAGGLTDGGRLPCRDGRSTQTDYS